MNEMQPVKGTEAGLRTLEAMLDRFCPMHLVLNESGHVIQAGPTLQKLRPGEELVGRRVLELFEVRRPHAITTMKALLTCAGTKLHLRFRRAPRTDLKGTLEPLPDGGAVVDLGFGISIIEAVRDYALVSSDFAATDLAMELLYLVEAKSAAMEASRKLNLRLQDAMIAAKEQAYTDGLTGLGNRRAMEHVLGRLIERGQPFALMQIDLDFFKAVNDTLGHAAGDHVLGEVARILTLQTREEDTIARIGGDEFVILFDGLTEEKALERTAHRIIDALEVPIPFGEELCRISASCGTVLAKEYKAPAAERMLEDADIALYASKNAGRAQHRFFRKEMRRDAVSSRATESARSGKQRRRSDQEL